MFEELHRIQSTLDDCRTSIHNTFQDAEQAYQQYEQVRDRCELDRQNLRLKREQLEKAKEVELAKVNALMVVEQCHTSFLVRISKNIPNPAAICKNKGVCCSEDNKWYKYYLEPSYVKDSVIPNALAYGLTLPTEEDRAASQAGGEFIMI